ncbi:MAG: TIGR00159 family protein [Sorangiineae bacterium NIC37A_2]|jgi:diadenylate cyclase|nr:MAG: TIGR00159 family protein [Sorangiineae bacterium NIC37A_2]
MLELIGRSLAIRTPIDALRAIADIAVVYYVFYRLLLVVKGTKAVQIGIGLVLFFLLYLIAERLGLKSVEALVRVPLESLLIVSVVVFQSDIRRALERFGSKTFLSGAHRAQQTEVIDEVVEAARILSRHRIGAIITIEQEANLDEFVGNNRGIDVDTKVNADLLVTLFVPEGINKLHDGAVIIRNLRVAKAGVFFPMPKEGSFDPSFGSRHRAALGITEETDAVVVVVSEERGTISCCFNGNIAADLEAPELRDMLLSILDPKAQRRKRRSTRSRAQERIAHSEPPPKLDLPQVERASSIPPPPLNPSPLPPPLRKSIRPESPSFDSDSDELRGPSQPRPMPRAGSQPNDPSGDPSS